ncbi:uncharacterized protein LOC114366526 [Ostrinia furnacalis]|uniref:uncharacterized protein LOC114366526 n=1 Tax=Ostrinia furnacalis TaxID=93504 RepID=UPI00103F1125|nr:uncharacterized protein LOC114366526 [Ostrinia furnacalis]
MNEELLIGLVRQYPGLFDPFDKKYHDELWRNSIWCEIAHIMEENPDTCRARWKRIRDNFRRAKTLRKTKMAQGSTKNKPVKYEEELAFLNPLLGEDTVRGRPRTPLGLMMEDDGDQTLSPPSPGSETRSNTAYKKRRMSNGQSSMRTLLHSYFHNSRTGEPIVVDFFTNLGRTVNTFPEDVQIRIKSEVFKIINHAEGEVLQRKVESGNFEQPSNFPVMMIPNQSPNHEGTQNENCYSPEVEITVEPKTEILTDENCDESS